MTLADIIEYLKRRADALESAPALGADQPAEDRLKAMEQVVAALVAEERAAMADLDLYGAPTEESPSGDERAATPAIPPPPPSWSPVAPILLPSKAGAVFRVDLTQTGGANATSGSTAATWTYTVTNSLTSESLGTAVDPTASPHYLARAIGKMNAATHGTAFYEEDGTLVLVAINEAPPGEACGAGA